MKRAYKWWSEEEKEKIFNFYINGKSYAEIAEIFNSTNSKIKNLVYRERLKRTKECLCIGLSKGEKISMKSTKIKINYCPKCGRKL